MEGLENRFNAYTHSRSQSFNTGGPKKNFRNKGGPKKIFNQNYIYIYVHLSFKLP